MSVIGVGWTLGVIFAFYFMFPFYVFLLSTKKRAWFTVIICFVLNWCCCNYYESVGKTDGANFLFLSVYFVIGGILYLYKDYIQEKVSRIPTFVVLLATAVITMTWYLIPANEFTLFFYGENKYPVCNVGDICYISADEIVRKQCYKDIKSGEFGSMSFSYDDIPSR